MEIQFSIDLNGKIWLVTEPKKVTYPPPPLYWKTFKKNDANQHDLTTVFYPICHTLQDGFHCRCNEF